MTSNDCVFLYVIWEDYKTKKRFIIGKLTRDIGYKFEYLTENVKEAINYGFEAFVAFSDVSVVYENEAMFPTFSSRLPDRRRKDIMEILHSYHLERYDEFDLLKKSGGKLPIDKIEFIDPVLFHDKGIGKAI